MAYEELPIEHVSLDDIRLDLDNFRITSGVTDEVEAIAYLYESEDVLNTAREILTMGYFDNEVPTAVRESDGVVVVLEGNRRISALKGLRDPSVAPKKYETRLRALLKRYAEEAKDLPARIRVLMAPNRQMTRPHVGRMHIGLTKKRWSLDQQANFFYSQLSEDLTPEDLKHLHPNERITKFMKMGSMRRFLKGAKFVDPSLHGYVSSNDLKISVLEYAYRHASICELIGVQFEKNGLIKPESTEPGKVASLLSPHNLAALECLVEKFRSGKLDTRSAALKAKTEEFDSLIAELQSIHDDAMNTTGRVGPSVTSSSEGGSSSSKGITSNSSINSPDSLGGAIGSSDTNSTATQQPTGDSDDNAESKGTKNGSAGISRGPNDPSTKNRLPLNGIDYEKDVHVNLHGRYQELRRMNYKDIPTATAIMMRSVLETTIKHHFARGQHTINEQLTYGMKCVDEIYGSKKELKSTIGYIRNGKAPGSIIWFNLSAHDFNLVVSPDEVYQAWRKVSPLLAFLLQNAPAEGLKLPSPPRQKQ